MNVNLKRFGLKSNSTNFKKVQNAFTLIELLVAISIIALLFGVILSNTDILRKTSSDAQIKADIAQIQSALQNYYADNNYFPKSTSGGFILNGASSTTSLTSTIGAASPVPSPSPTTKTYLRTVPKDPADTYCYKAVKSSSSGTVDDCDNATNGNCHYYYLSAKLQNPGTAMVVPAPGICTGLTNNYYTTP